MINLLKAKSSDEVLKKFRDKLESIRETKGIKDFGGKEFVAKGDGYEVWKLKDLEDVKFFSKSNYGSSDLGYFNQYYVILDEKASGPDMVLTIAVEYAENDGKNRKTIKNYKNDTKTEEYLNKFN